MDWYLILKIFLTAYIVFWAGIIVIVSHTDSKRNVLMNFSEFIRMYVMSWIKMHVCAALPVGLIFAIWKFL